MQAVWRLTFQSERRCMKKCTLWMITALCCFLLTAHAGAREYNIWYKQDGVLYGMAQTDDGHSVMLSFSQAGYSSASLVISLIRTQQCPDSPPALNINSGSVPAGYYCEGAGGVFIEHYILRDATVVNALFGHLQAGFTLLILDNIKVWASNIQKPVYGMGTFY